MAFALPLVPALPTAAFAAAETCRDADTTAEMRACANQRLAAADAELNAVYGRLAAQLPSERRARLRSAQRAWIQFRDQQAAFVASQAEGGTLAPIIEVSELESMTRQRTAELKSFLEQLLAQ